MVNKAVEEMVLMHYDSATWEAIRELSGIEVEVFISNDGYPDAMTYELVAAASKVLDIPADQVLEAFGEHWVLVTAQEGYGELMRGGGHTLAEFLRNLPGFHARVSLLFPDLKPPSFRVSDLASNSLHLHYASHRAGLQPFIVGLIRGLGKYFATPVDVTMIASRQDGADHDTFRVEWPDVDAK